MAAIEGANEGEALRNARTNLFQKNSKLEN